jgi:hypothetical protein
LRGGLGQPPPDAERFRFTSIDEYRQFVVDRYTAYDDLTDRQAGGGQAGAVGHAWRRGPPIPGGNEQWATATTP